MVFPTKHLKRTLARFNRAIFDNYVSDMVNICIDTTSDKILGASIVRIGASKIISEINLAMQTVTIL